MEHCLFSPDLFRHNRFVVAISKYDVRFSEGSLQRNSRALGASRSGGQSAANIVQILQQKTRSFISESVKCQPPPDVDIIPVSAIWATTALWLRADPQEDDIQAAKQILASYPDPLPQGQGEAGPLDLASSLDIINGIPALEAR